MTHPAETPETSRPVAPRPRFRFSFRRAWTAAASDLPAFVADRYGLTLASAGIRRRFRHGAAPGRWDVQVPEADLERARAEIEAYLRENPDAMLEALDGDHAGAVTFPGESGSQELSLAWSRGWGLAAAGALMAGQAALAAGGVERYGTAVASRIMSGEVWRALTALWLHADAAHLGGNMLGLGMFGGMVGLRTGAGIGWLLVVLAGTLGNVLNAWLYAGILGIEHRSIGASTAVFAAVGLLGGVGAFGGRRGTGVFGQQGRLQALIPVGAALGLLAMLGVGEEGKPGVDVAAHACGFVAGLGLGLGWRALGRRIAERLREAGALQIACGLIALAACAAAWALAAKRG